VKECIVLAQGVQFSYLVFCFPPPPLMREIRSLVIWYDSVTRTGELKWQNALTPANQPFFDVCDGIFTKHVTPPSPSLLCREILTRRSYWWKADAPTRSAALAGARAADVFVGVDVWGRGTFGGGGHVLLPCCSGLPRSCRAGRFDNRRALSMIRDAGTSLALFAPGWV
jgi:mannosyl-glycoprotein endo-beta-N-acetylglucosaminidase